MKYGHSGTIHQTTDLDVEVRDGRVVAVWFRCMALPFQQADVSAERAASMNRLYNDGPAKVPALLAVEVSD